MVNKDEAKEEQDGAAARIIVLAKLKEREDSAERNKGISITGLVNECEISRMRVRIAIAYLLGSGKIEEEGAGMTKLYFLTE